MHVTPDALVGVVTSEDFSRQVFSRSQKKHYFSRKRNQIEGMQAEDSVT